MSDTHTNKRVTHARTKRKGICKGPSPEHTGWYAILWDGETDCYLYTSDEFHIHAGDEKPIA